MIEDRLSLAAVVIMLFPMLYFLFASLTFFFATLRDPVVTRMLRGLFNTYFVGVTVAGALGASAFGRGGHPMVAAVFVLAVVGAVAARRWFLQRLDAQVRARDTGDAVAVSRLRRLHVAGIAYNAVQLACLVASIPFLVPVV